VTLPSVDATMMVLPEADGPNSFRIASQDSASPC
jgi:hypothetical protein